MKKLILILTLTVAGQPGSFAADSTETGFGESLALGVNFYHKVHLISVIDGTALISSNEGEIKVPWTALPVDFQKKHVGEIEELNARVHDEAIGAKLFSAKITQTLEGGSLVKQEKKSLFIQGLSGFADGAMVKIKAYPDGLYSYKSTSGANRTVEKWVFISLYK